MRVSVLLYLQFLKITHEMSELALILYGLHSHHYHHILYENHPQEMHMGYHHCQECTKVHGVKNFYPTSSHQLKLFAFQNLNLTEKFLYNQKLIFFLETYKSPKQKS